MSVTAAMTMRVYVAPASENHHGDQLLERQHLHFKTHFLPSFLLEFILMSRKVYVSQLDMSLFCISAYGGKKEGLFSELNNCRNLLKT